MRHFWMSRNTGSKRIDVWRVKPSPTFYNDDDVAWSGRLNLIILCIDDFKTATGYEFPEGTVAKVRLTIERLEGKGA